MNDMKLIEPIQVTESVLFSSNVVENDYPVWSATAAYALGDKRILTAAHKIYECVKASSAAVVTITMATPGVVTWAAHGLADGTPISFATSGTLPTGLTPGVTYYVKSPTTDTFNLAATSGGAAISTSGSQSGVHTGTAQSNFNRSPDTNPTFWVEVGATNRWRMFDEQNSTQTTTNADSITVELKPVVIANGIYVGNVDADSVTVTVTDAVEGVVYTSTQSMAVSNSGSSFYNWFFKRIAKKTAVAFTDLPAYVNATVTVVISKVGGTAKCGMCVVGQVSSLGVPLMGVSTDIKDYSTVQFNSDGTSTTILRGYAKRMSCDLLVENDVKDSIENQLAGYRQTPVVWIASSKYETTMIYGKYSSFKTVIETFPRSRMSLQIEGMV